MAVIAAPGSPLKPERWGLYVLATVLVIYAAFNASVPVRAAFSPGARSLQRGGGGTWRRLFAPAAGLSKNTSAQPDGDQLCGRIDAAPTAQAALRLKVGVDHCAAHWCAATSCFSKLIG